MPDLKVLDVSHTHLDADRVLRTVAKHCPNLEELNLARCAEDSCSDGGVEALARSRCAAGLRVLHLDGADDLTDVSLNLLTVSCKSLEALYVAECRHLTGEGITNAARALPVRSMSFRGTGLSRSAAFRVLGILHAR